MVSLPFGHKYGIEFYLILAILVINRLWVLHSSRDVGMFLRGSHFVINIEKKISKNPSQIVFREVYHCSELGN